MSPHARLLAACAALVVLLACPRVAAAPAPWPEDSIYQLDVALVDQQGHAFRLADRGGRAQLISMFYTSCQYACPLIIEALKTTLRELTPAERDKLDVLLVSFDPVRDTPERLREVFTQRRLERGRWTLARAEPPQVRELAALLDIGYRALDNGDFNHSSVLIVLDAHGRAVARTDRLGEPDAAFVQAIKRLIASPQVARTLR